MQRNTQRLIISENSTHTFLKPLNEFLNGYSEIKLLCLWLNMYLNVARIYKRLFTVSMHTIDKKYYNTQHTLKSDIALSQKHMTSNIGQQSLTFFALLIFNKNHVSGRIKKKTPRFPLKNNYFFLLYQLPNYGGS